jgi:putative ABC transport system ATP-binding protein
VSTSEVLGIFDRLSAEGHTVVVITHEPDVAEHARRVIRLRDGLVIDDADQQYTQPRFLSPQRA